MLEMIYTLNPHVSINFKDVFRYHVIIILILHTMYQSTNKLSNNK